MKALRNNKGLVISRVLLKRFSGYDLANFLIESGYVDQNFDIKVKKLVNKRKNLLERLK